MRAPVHDFLISFRIGIAFGTNKQDYRISIDTEQVAKRFILKDPVDETVGYGPGFSGDDCFVTANGVCIGAHAFFRDGIITGAEENCFVPNGRPGHPAGRAAIQTGHNG